jgi:predicted RND superfamily exporter protein
MLVAEEYIRQFYLILKETIERKDSEAKESLEKKLKTTRTKTESSVDRKETPTRKSSNNSIIMQSIRREISSKGLPSPKQGYLKGESPLNGRVIKPTIPYQ